VILVRWSPKVSNLFKKDSYNQYNNSYAGSTGGRNVLRRNYTGKKPVVIQHRSQDAVNYYDHENVRLSLDLTYFCYTMISFRAPRSSNHHTLSWIIRWDARSLSSAWHRVCIISILPINRLYSFHVFRKSASHNNLV